MKPTPEQIQSAAEAAAKSEAMKANFAKLWPTLLERFRSHAAPLVTDYVIAAAKECAWQAFRAGRNT